ncbi:hypothetical protein LQ772_12675 [Frateuria edaphi]|uniref:hypothetical protein n=1 Tax=Frateuria edaphi TaxID=2898793 RepID=UPI001E3C53E7|nr:hypothetical protein [Frateuria edaphi]UGB44841.1 hypothetical protein LQ772_12675 [Frateuria edaphi]
MRFRGKIEGQTYGAATTAPPGLNLLRLEETLSAAHLRPANAYIEHLPRTECVAKYDRARTLFLMDPPYWETEGYGVDFGWDQYEALASTVGSTKGRAILNLMIIRRSASYSVAFTSSARHTYTVGGDKAEKIGDALIFYWDLREQPAGLM